MPNALGLYSSIQWVDYYNLLLNYKPHYDKYNTYVKLRTCMTSIHCKKKDSPAALSITDGDDLTLSTRLGGVFEIRVA